jgi:predicted ATP-grasp superfamily ATP-dependent carboligase
VQDFAPGEPASVSVVVGRDVDPDSIRALPLGLNRQRMTGLSRPVYTGGESGWPHPMATAAIRTAIEAVTALARAAPGCRGYLGVDLILGPSGPVVIEINPRITTAYIGIRRVVDRNLAGLILDACRARALPRAVSVSGRCRFDGGGAVKAIRDDGARTGEVRQCRSTAAGTSAASI